MALKQPRPEWEKTQKTKKAASLLQLTACVFCGAPEEIRTPGLQVRSLLLYPAELRARCEKLCIAIALSCQILSRKKSFFVRKPLPAFRLPVWQKAQGSPFPRTRCHRAGSSTAGQDSEYARQKTERRSMEVTSPQRRRGDRPGSQSHRLCGQDDRNVFLMRGRAAPLHHRHRPHTAKKTFQIWGTKNGPQLHWNPSVFLWSGWRDLNARPQRPERCALAKLSHIPLQEGTLRRSRLPCKLFLQKNFSGHLRPFRARGISGKTFGNIGQLGFDFIKKGATTLMPVRLPGKNLFEVALCRTQDPRTISATARN